MRNGIMNCVVGRLFLAGMILVLLGPLPSQAQRGIFGSKEPADTSSVEWLKVYFNQPADHSVALPGNRSRSRWDLIGTLTNRIDSAKYSVDLCVYDLEHPRVARALAKAGRRGVAVRVITDDHNRNDSERLDQAMWDSLRQAGIISIDDDGDVYLPNGEIRDHDLVNSGADMHHKFAVIDAASESPDDDYVWTGSTNLTLTGAYNTNNTIVIKDNEVAATYLQEFNQMWGGEGPQPRPNRSVFHKDKQDVDEHTFWVGNTKVEVYFAPVNRWGTKPSISDRLVELMREEAQHDVNFQAFAITPTIPVSETMWELSARGQVQLNGVIDRQFYYRYKNSGDIWASAEAQLANRSISPSDEMRKLHDKVLILDAAHPDPADQGIVIAGSYNFSNNAEFNNDENLLIIYSDRIANQYYQNFKGVQGRAAGNLPIPAPKIDHHTSYPVHEVRDGGQFEIEVVEGFGYPVTWLGVDVPSFYAAPDSADYFAGTADQYVHRMLNGKRVKISGPYGSYPDAKYGRFIAYVTLISPDGDTTHANRQLLKAGVGTYSKYYSQHPDSVREFRDLEIRARADQNGMWKQPQNMGSLIPRSVALGEPGGGGGAAESAFPINVNTADMDMLQLLPGVGPAYAKRIVSHRERFGAFATADELQKIKGIGPKTVAKLRPLITF
ncbi:MAG: phospholipase D-like domain-containing protein [Bacteroidota bacterium]